MTPTTPDPTDLPLERKALLLSGQDLGGGGDARRDAAEIGSMPMRRFAADFGAAIPAAELDRLMTAARAAR